MVARGVAPEGLELGILAHELLDLPEVPRLLLRLPLPAGGFRGFRQLRSERGRSSGLLLSELVDLLAALREDGLRDGAIVARENGVHHSEGGLLRGQPESLEPSVDVLDGVEILLGWDAHGDGAPSSTTSGSEPLQFLPPGRPLGDQRVLGGLLLDGLRDVDEALQIEGVLGGGLVPGIEDGGRRPLGRILLMGRGPVQSIQVHKTLGAAGILGAPQVVLLPLLRIGSGMIRLESCNKVP